MKNTFATVELDYVELLSTIDIHLVKIPKRYQKDNEETRHDILVAVLQRVKSFDPARSSWPTFLDRTIRKAVRNFLLSKRWRKNRSPESFEEIELQKIPLVNEHPFGELGIHEKSVFAEELHEAIRSMPVELAECCRRLMHYTISETAELLNIPKQTLHHRLKKIQRILTEENFAPDSILAKEKS